MNLIPIVLSGGSGTRLWPISRNNYPKQFSPLLDQTLQTLTLKRLKNYQPALIVTGEKLKVLTEKEIAEHQFKVQGIIYESEGKNTAPAVAMACKYLQMKGLQNNVCGVFSSDALITKEDAFHHAVQVAAAEALAGKVVVLGIKPDRTETGFGYIQLAQNPNLDEATKVLNFHEKPNYQTAEKFVADRNYFWNAGIFIFQVEKMIQQFKLHQPEMWAAVSELQPDLSNIAQIYSRIKSISFDYAIVEKLKTEQLSCVPCDIGWSDLGSWDVLEQINSKSEKKLGLIKPSVQVEASGNTVFSKQKKIYSFVGVDDLIVVDTDDAILICKKEHSQKVKDVVEIIKRDVNTGDRV